jgi:hypothetical protein
MSGFHLLPPKRPKTKDQPLQPVKSLNDAVSQDQARQETNITTSQQKPSFEGYEEAVHVEEKDIVKTPSSRIPDPSWGQPELIEKPTLEQTVEQEPKTSGILFVGTETKPPSLEKPVQKFTEDASTHHDTKNSIWVVDDSPVKEIELSEEDLLQEDDS